MFVPTGFLLGTSAVKTLKSKKHICCRFLRYLDGIVWFFFSEKKCKKRKTYQFLRKSGQNRNGLFFFSLYEMWEASGRQAYQRAQHNETSGGQVEYKWKTRIKSCGPGMQPFERNKKPIQVNLCGEKHISTFFIC